ncbi:MAG: T9SS type A sorting domain-containing protein [Flavobacteriaceae bacterium]|nr:T9SS type A sorting domain-containing protein [Flavobacteriaceae bacterium]
MKKSLCLLFTTISLSLIGQQSQKIANFNLSPASIDFAINATPETLDFPTSQWLDVADVSWYNESMTTFDIATPEQLAGLSLLVSQGNNFSGKILNQTQDLDLNGNLWFPIGGVGVDAPFSGTYNGNDFIIQNLFINLPEDDFVGLFGHSVSSVLTGIRLQNADIIGLDTVGSVVANLYGGTVTNSSADNVTIVATGYNVGGFAGGLLTDAYMENCSATNVNVTGENQIGGLIGSVWDNADVKFAYSTGEVNGNYIVGGLIGFSTMAFAPYRDNTVEHSFSHANVTAGLGLAGGFYGYPQFNAIIENCYSTGTATGEQNVGGFVGITSMLTTLNNHYDMQTSGHDFAVGGVENGDPNQVFNITGQQTAFMTSAEFVEVMNTHENEWYAGEAWNAFYPFFNESLSVSDVRVSDPKIKAYPNPVKGEQLFFDKKVSGVVYNALGQRIMSFENQNSIRVSQWAKGVYFVQILTDSNQKQSIKVVK